VPKLDLIDENQFGFAIGECKVINLQILPQMLQHEAIIWVGPLLKLPPLGGPVFELVLKQWLDAIMYVAMNVLIESCSMTEVSTSISQNLEELAGKRLVTNFIIVS